MFIFEGMWKGVLFGFLVFGTVITMYFTVFSKIMPGVNDEGDEIKPSDM